jgi:alkylhydroperoxidase/carboxymuconolactone decarboxylase family protein YurZ
VNKPHAAGEVLADSWWHALLLLSGAVAALVVARAVDNPPVRIGGRFWVPFLPLALLVVLLPAFAMLANSAQKRLAGWLLAIVFSLPFWIIAVTGVLDGWNRKHDLSPGAWMQASIASKSATRRGYYFLGHLEQPLAGARPEIRLPALENSKPGDKIWVKVHDGALGWPWGSAARTTPPE